MKNAIEKIKEMINLYSILDMDFEINPKYNQRTDYLASTVTKENFNVISKSRGLKSLIKV